MNSAGEARGIQFITALLVESLAVLLFLNGFNINGGDRCEIADESRTYMSNSLELLTFTVL